MSAATSRQQEGETPPASPCKRSHRESHRTEPDGATRGSRECCQRTAAVIFRARFRRDWPLPLGEPLLLPLIAYALPHEQRRLFEAPSSACLAHHGRCAIQPSETPPRVPVPTTTLPSSDMSAA